eukprot:PLAT304.1.p1 GENE.PLAT304.1~~PLAT304.1.p1  ORF type:complete len:523 (+),score=228.19 PLAT304.1:187-1755(+)
MEALIGRLSVVGEELCAELAETRMSGRGRNELEEGKLVRIVDAQLTQYRLRKLTSSERRVLRSEFATRSGSLDAVALIEQLQDAGKPTRRRRRHRRPRDEEEEEEEEEEAGDEDDEGDDVRPGLRHSSERPEREWADEDISDGWAALGESRHGGRGSSSLWEDGDGEAAAWRKTSWAARGKDGRLRTRASRARRQRRLRGEGDDEEYAEERLRETRRTGVLLRSFGGRSGERLRRAWSKLHRAAESMKLPGSRISSTLLRQLREMDVAESGVLSRRAFAEAVLAMERHITKDELHMVTEHFATDAGGPVRYEPFVDWVAAPAFLDGSDIEATEDRLRRVLSAGGPRLRRELTKYDRDNAGMVKLADWRLALHALGLAMREDDLDAISEVRRTRRSGGRGGRSRELRWVPFLALFRDYGEQRQSYEAKWASAYTDWSAALRASSAGLGDDADDLPVPASGSVGEWLETVASPVEQKNFFELMGLLTAFERKLGLQQRRQPAGSPVIELQLGSRLAVRMSFVMK